MSANKTMMTIEKRILLHLLDYHNYRVKIDVPIALTKNGIAPAVGANYAYVSFHINELVARGFVRECFGRVERGVKKQNYFLLTEVGEEYTKKLKTQLSDLQITLKPLDGKSKMMALKDIVPYLDGEGICPGITVLDIYNNISKDHTLDIKHLKKIMEKQFLDFSAEAPILMHFFGRKREIELLEKWMEDKERHKIVLIYGMAGIGKTTLAVKLIEKYRGSKSLFWHNFHELDTLGSVLFKLAKFLSRLGDDHLEIYLRIHKSLDYYEASTILRNSMGKIDAVLIFDDFDKSGDEIKKFLNYILRMLTFSSKTKILILSREFVPFYDRRDVFEREIVTELELEGLDFESSKKLLIEKCIDKSKFKMIFESTAGNPLFLEIFESKDDLEKFMHDELFSKLEEEERKILGIISIYRFPISEDFLAVSDDIDFEKLYDLMQKSIVKKDAYDRYFIHDIIKEFFYNRLPPSKRRKHHLLAARGYKNMNEPTNLTEAIFHYQMAGEYKKACRIATDRSTSIFDGGYAAEFLATLERFDEKNVETSVWAEILILKGRARKMCGEWKKALLYFNQSGDIATMIGDKKLEVKVICESGHILEEQNQFDRAMDCFKRGLDISKGTDYLLGIGECYRGIGRIYWRKEDREKAIANFRKSLEISERLDDPGLMASIYTDLGNVYDEVYEIESSIECYNKSLHILKKCNNTYETARAYANLAITYEHLEKFEKSIEYNTKHLALAQKLHDMKLLGYGYAEMGYCFARTGEFEKAKGYTEKAEEIALKLDNDNIMNMINKTYGLICKHEEKWNEGIGYFKRSLEYLEKLRASYQLPDSHFQLGLLYEEMDDTENAKKHLGMAQKLYSKAGLEKAELVREKLSKYNDDVATI